MVKTNGMTVEVSNDHLCDQLSLRYPKNNRPTTVPAKTMELTLAAADEPAYSTGYALFSMVLTGPMILGSPCQR